MTTAVPILSLLETPIATAEPARAAMSDKALSERLAIEALKEKIRQYVRHRSQNDEATKLEYAFEDIEHYHGQQRRKSGEPVIIHPLRVSWSVCEAGLDAQSAVVALLHDTIEDTAITKDYLRERYGEWYAEVVDGLTKITERVAGKKKRANTEATYQKMLMAMLKDVRSLFIKLFDRLDNLRDLDFMPRYKQRRTSHETLNIYVPMAKRLGLEKITQEHIELCFKYLYPKRYQRTIQKLEELKKQRTPIIHLMKQRLEYVLKTHQAQAEVEAIMVHPSAHVDKIEVDRVLEGFRVFVDTPLQTYHVLGIFHTSFRAVPLKIRDFISNPRWNGYQGLQSEIVLEGEAVMIEIVSREMHALNQHGIMAHWKGTAHQLAEYYQIYLTQLDELAGEKDLRMDDVFRYVQAEQIQIFTPKGQTFFFPKGATVLDFAYQIHSALGNSCIGAVVNPPSNAGDIKNNLALLSKRVPRDRKLFNGEIVYVLTDPDVRPSREWLDKVVTAKAKLQIMKALKQQNTLRTRQIGRDLLVRELEILGEPFTDFVASDALQKTLGEEKLNLDSFYEQLGLKRLDVRQFIKQYELVSPQKIERREFRERFFKRWGNWFGSAEQPDVSIEDMNDPFLRFAECCSPLPGDKIVGFPTEENDLEIHRANCPQVKVGEHLMPVSVAWNLPEEETKEYVIHLITIDAPGVIYQLTKVIKNLGVGIANSHSERLEENPQDAYIRITLEPISWKLYHKILERLRALKVVKKIW